MRQPVPFGKYLLLDRISVGGMAEVFRAKSFGVEGFEKLLAIKRILPSMADDREFLRMFVDEAKIAGQLSHPSIAQIYELGREGNSPYIAMEYVWGKDLLQIYNRFRKLGERMPTTMACHVMAKACEALDYAHRKRDPLGNPLQIVHRDCSPQNILVSYEGEVKIIDFGIAKAASRMSQTNAGVLKGKFAYLSPEQVRGVPIDRRSDLFALGTVFFECLTGERLFHSDSDFTTLERVRDADVPRPRDVCPDLPEEVERILLRILAKDPDDRYQHGREIYRELQEFLRTQEHPYTASALGSWIRRAFPREMDRERDLLERYRRIGPDGKPRPSSPVLPTQLDAEVLLSSTRSPRAGLDPPPATDDEVGLDGDTLLGGPDIADLEPDAIDPPAPLGRVPKPSVATSDFADEAPTEVHGEIGDKPRSEPLSAGASPDGEGAKLIDAIREKPTGKRGAQAASEGHRGDDIQDLSDEIEVAPDSEEPASSPENPRGPGATLLAPGGAPAARAARAATRPPPVPGNVGRTLRMDKRPQADERDAVPAALPKEPTASVRLGPRPDTVSTASGASSRPSIFRDIGIGMAIAAVLLMAALGVRALAFGEDEEPASAKYGSLELDLTGLDDVTVLLDGERVAEAQRGELVLTEVEPGQRRVEVLRRGETLCSREISVRSGGQASVSCAPAPSLPGALILEGAGDDHRVRIAGEFIDVDPAREAIKLASGAPQRVEILRDGEVVQEFEVAAEPGEIVRRSIAMDEAAEEADESVEVEREASAVEQTRRQPERAPAHADRETGGIGLDLSSLEEPRLLPEAAPTPEKGYLTARTRPWARVYIDGRDTGVMTPIARRAKIPLRPGRRRITFEVGDQTFTYHVRVEPGEVHEIVEDLPVDR